MLVKTQDGTQDVPMINALTGEYNVNAGNYIVPAGEEALYHVIQEQKKFNAETGKRLSKPVIQKYGKKEYESIVQRQLRLQGFQVVVLHEPVIEGKKSAATTKTSEVSALRDELAALKAELAAMRAKKPTPPRKPQPKAQPKTEEKKN